MRTRPLRSGPEHDKLFISYVKPHKPVSKDTVARWLKNVLAQAGIVMAVFRPHSTRAATALHLKARGNSIKDIMERAGWSSQTTFSRINDKPLLKTVSGDTSRQSGNVCLVDLV